MDRIGPKGTAGFESFRWVVHSWCLGASETYKMACFFGKKINSEQCKEPFLQSGLNVIGDVIAANRVASQYIITRIIRYRVRHSPNIECAFINDEIKRATNQLTKLRAIYQSHWLNAHVFLSFFDKIKFC